jgi:O-antigen/teichoic acid export membrane protein
MRGFVKDFISIGVSKFAMIFFSLVTTIITARFLGPEMNGIIASLIVYPSIFLSFGSLGIKQSTTFLLGQNLYKEEEIKTTITQIWFLTTLFSLILCFVLIKFIGKNDNLTLIILAILPIPFVLFNTYNSGVFLGKNQIKEFNQINWLPTLVIFLLTILNIVILKLDVEGYLIALIGGPLVISMFLLFKMKFFKSFRLKVNRILFKKLLGLGVIYALSLLIINLNYKFDVIMISSLSTKYELGIYSKGSSITEFLWQIPMLLSTIVFARSATSKNSREFSLKVCQLLRVSIVFIFLGSSFLFLFSDSIIIGMFGESYKQSSQVLNNLLPGVLLLTIYKVLNMDLSGRGKPWIAIFAMLPALIINVVLNYFLIPKYGAVGAAFASTISYSSAAIIFLIVYSLEVKISLKEILSYSKNDFEHFSKFLKWNKK